MIAGIALTVLFAVMFPLYRAYEPSGRAENRARLSASLTDQGQDLYATSCASCHGATGEGVDAPALNSQQFLAAADDTQIRSLIAHGVPGTAMAAYSLDFGGFFTSEQIEAIATYLRSLEPTAPDRPDWQRPSQQGDAVDDHDEDLPEPADHDGEEEQGQSTPEVEPKPEPFDAAEAFANTCARCHGADLNGSDDGPPLGPSSHSLAEPDEHLVEAITFGRDEMPAFLDELTGEQIDQIVRYIRDRQGAE
jgi:mono/diheme cytochrome c family protein